MPNRRRLWPVVTAVLVGLPVVYVLSLVEVYFVLCSGMLPDSLHRPLSTYLTPLWGSYDYGPSWWRRFLEYLMGGT